MMRNNRGITAPLGIRIDFCEGVHVRFPPGERKFHLRVSSLANGESVFDGDIQSLPTRQMEFKSRQTYFVPWQVEIRQNGRLIFVHHLNLTGREVCVNLLPGAMGDMVAWMPAALNLRRERNCRLTILMKPEYIQVFESAHPDVRFIPLEKFSGDDYYAVYPVGVWGYGNLDLNPTDFQHDNLIDHADNILGVKSNREPPELAAATRDCRAAYGRYVCIATRASRKMKQWNHPGGWERVTAFLKEHGYRVFCIDADNTAMPANAEDFTGPLPLRERIDLLRGCEFFIGLTSGLSWLAWGCRIPAVMISGCTMAWVEFPSPYRIIDPSVCHGCFNRGDMRFNEFDKCPENRNFECTSAISPERVIAMIKTIPGFSAAAPTHTGGSAKRKE